MTLKTKTLKALIANPQEALNKAADQIIDPDPLLMVIIPADAAPGVTHWRREKCAILLERVAGGATLTSGLKALGVNPRVWWNWLEHQPGVRKIYDAARMASAQILVDEALDLARENRRKPVNEVVNSATRILIDMLKWSAARMNPAEFGEHAQPAATISIKINTNLALKAPGSGAIEPPPDSEYATRSYKMRAVISDPPIIDVKPDLLPETRLDKLVRSRKLQARAKRIEKESQREKAGPENPVPEG